MRTIVPGVFIMCASACLADGNGARPQKVMDREIEFAANAVIIYAWNEHDEGGWLSPTRTAEGKPDTSRLDAIRDVLKKEKQGGAR
jgi:hypothetical protein